MGSESKRRSKFRHLAGDDLTSAPVLALHATPWALSPQELLQHAGVTAERGLSATEILALRRRSGINQLRTIGKRRLPAIVADQFKSLVVLLLLAAAALAFSFTDVAEGAAILAVVAINATIGFSIEWRATRSMEALRHMARVETVVLRDGRLERIPAEDLVPGDIVHREAGDIVSADMRVINSAKLQVNESALTGEAVPISKNADAIGVDSLLIDRSNMLYSGTIVTRGTGVCVVVATGQSTELGRIADLVATAAPEETPLERRLEALGVRLAKIVLVTALLIAVIGILGGRDLFLSIEVAIALGVAAIPEGLPVVATIALAHGMWLMAQRNAVIARLSAVETLGTTSVIVTDKTGTLTENRMTVTEVFLAGEVLNFASICSGTTERERESSARVRELLQIAVLCNNAELRTAASDDKHAIGDPTEVALLLAADRCGVQSAECRRRLPELLEVPFEPETKLMATLHAQADRVLYAVKGAPESVLEHCSQYVDRNGEAPLNDVARVDLLEQAGALGKRGLRTLALASKTCADGQDVPYRNLTFIGFVGLEDPARAGVAEAISRCRAADIRVVMGTGDHAATALEIARDTGIVDAGSATGTCVDGAGVAALLEEGSVDALKQVRVFSRVTPEQKLRLIEHYQKAGEIVAMIGDGVNDAPALRQADIGIAMGIRGTAVAKEAAAMVLLDDEFSTIVDAVAQGRVIYDNIRKFVVYLLSCNASEIMIVSLATLAGAPLPLLPLQILFLNLVTDVFPALALGVGKGSGRLMKQSPRPVHEPLITRKHWIEIFAHGVVISLASLGAMAIALIVLDLDLPTAVTVSFCTLALAQLWHVFNMRTVPQQLLCNEISRNPWIWAALLLCLTSTIAAVYVPAIAGVLSLQAPGGNGWLLIFAMSLLPALAGGPLAHMIRRN